MAPALDLNWPAVALLGVVVGLLAGAFGVGGGFLLTPLLSVVFRVPMPIAVGTGLCQMVGAATAGYLSHTRLRQGEPRFALLMLPGSLLGVTLGAQLIAELKDLGEITIRGQGHSVVSLTLYAVYFIFLAGVGASMWKRGVSSFEVLDYVRRGPWARVQLPPYIDLPRVPLTKVSALLIAYSGLVLGFLSGFLGISGGIALVPLLLYGFGFPFRHAAGTGVIITLVTAVVGTLVHARAGNIELRLAMVLLVGSAMSAQVGALISHRFSARALRRTLAAIVFATAAMVLYQLVRVVV